VSSFPASSRKIAGAALLFSHASTVAGRSAVARGVVKSLQPGPDAVGLVAEQLTQPLPDGAAGAPAGVDPPGLPAARAGAPESGSGRVQAAQRGSPWCAADPASVSAPRAARPSLLAGFAPRLAGRLRQVARSIPAADRAGHGLHRAACRAQRPVRGADADRPPAAAAGADLQVGRVGDQAMRAQRPLRSSRTATCCTAPHRAHGWKRDLATQLRQHQRPSIRRCR